MVRVPEARRRSAGWGARLAALILGGALALALGEGAARVYLAATAQPAAAGGLHRLTDEAWIYEPDPAHPEISSQGLRERELEVPVPLGTSRILVLGDSVPYGDGVRVEQAFPRRLEALLGDGRPGVQTVNAGVLGWSTWNQLHWYRERGQVFGAGIVVVAFSLNDVTNPRLHWYARSKALGVVPDDAIPDVRDDRSRVLPVLESLWGPEEMARSHPSWLRRSRLFCLLDRRLGDDRALREHQEALRRGTVAEHGGREWPAYLTGEDTLGVDVLLDPTSPQWRWLGSTWDRLFDAIEQAGARPVLLYLPVAWQLEPGYPFRPQDQVAAWAGERGIPFVDPLPSMADHATWDVFLGERSGYLDIWHLTPLGHDLVAHALATALAPLLGPEANSKD